LKHPEEVEVYVLNLNKEARPFDLIADLAPQLGLAATLGL
jgi:hypothetical protein